MALASLSKDDAIEMMVAQANREAAIVHAKSKRNNFEAGRSHDQIHVEQLAAKPITNNTTKQKIGPDTALESLVDSLPHWLFHTTNLNDTPSSTTPLSIQPTASRLMQVSSIERAYRHLWQESLWQGSRLVRSENRLTHVPRNIATEERWQSWITRDQTLKMQQSFLDGVAFHGKKAAKPTIDPLLKRSILAIEKRHGKKRQLIVGTLRRWGETQKWHHIRWSTVENSYIYSYTDIPLPKLSPLKITVRDVFRAWCVISDLVEIMTSELPKPNISSRDAMRKYSLPASRNNLREALSSALEVEQAAAQRIIEFLTVDPANNSTLFNKGLWSAPIVERPNSDTLYLVSAVFSNGSPFRAAEAWLERGGAAKNSVPIGKIFERSVREQLAKSIAENPLLTSTLCPQSKLPTQEDGEEIDALVVVGSRVLVIEAKCFVSPAEPIERYNFLKNIEAGCRQALRKSLWLASNLKFATRAFDLEEERIKKMKFLPLVVTNQSFGAGHASEEVPIVDLHYLTLLFGDGCYGSDSAIWLEDGTSASATIEMYRNQEELENKLEALLRDPVPLRRFANRYAWTRVPFPSSGGDDFGFLAPHLADPPFATPHTEYLEKLVIPKGHFLNKQ
jgi:hypothetical protein